MQHARKRRFSWSAANGGVTNGGLNGVWTPFLEIGRNRPFSPFFCLFQPFAEAPNSTCKIQKTEEKGLFTQIPSDLLNPPSLKPPFWERKKPINRKHINIFRTALVGQLSQGRTSTRPRDKRDKMAILLWN